MANPPRAKGTRWEVELRTRLRKIFYPHYKGEDDDHPLQRLDEAARHKRADDGDFTGVPFAIEAKSTKRPMFQEWARKLEKKTGKAWAIVWHGDRRVRTGTGPYVVMPLELFEQLTYGQLDMESRPDRLKGYRFYLGHLREMRP